MKNSKLIKITKNIISNNEIKIKIYLITEYHLNEKTGKIFTKQKIGLSEDSAEFGLYNIDLNPERLIELAKQLSNEKQDVENLAFN